MRLLALLLLLGGCGLQPVYSNGGSGAAASALAGIDVAAIEGRGGFLVRQALLDRVGSAGGSYRLDVRLDDAISGFGVRGDDSITRERRQLRARWQLIDATGKVIIDATARADSGIDVVGSEYAVVAAENAALERLAEDIAEQITARVALYARSQTQP
jgi:LPS-assembly lipoprotein